MRLTEYLEKNGLSVGDFGKQLGISGASVSRIANGKQNVDLDLVIAVERMTAGAVTAADLVSARTKDAPANEAHPRTGTADQAA